MLNLNRSIALLLLQQSSTKETKAAFVKTFFCLARWCFGALLSLVTLYYVLSSPPLHFFYDIAPAVGTSTIYIPGKYSMWQSCLLWDLHAHVLLLRFLGGGFSGFWFHLGLLQSIDKVEDYDYYCFSSGCFSECFDVIKFLRISPMYQFLSHPDFSRCPCRAIKPVVDGSGGGSPDFPITVEDWRAEQLWSRESFLRQHCSTRGRIFAGARRRFVHH